MTKNSGTIKVLLCDDHEVVLQGLKTILAKEPNIKVIGELNSIDLLMNFFQQPAELLPDVLLMDARLKDASGFNVRKLLPEQSKVRMYIFSSFDDYFMILKAKQEGFSGFLSKEIPSQTLIDVIRYPHLDFISYPSLKPGTMLDEMEDMLSAINQLTRRELDIIKQIITGKSTKECAAELHISAYTFETHKKNIFRKLEVKNIQELIKVSLEYKLN